MVRTLNKDDAGVYIAGSLTTGTRKTPCTVYKNQIVDTIAKRNDAAE